MIKVGGPALIIAVLVFAFAACGGSESAPQATSSPAATFSFTATPPPSTQPAVGTLAFSIAGSIYTMRPDGADLRQLLAASAERYAAPALSPDGQRLAYIADSKRIVVTEASDVASVLSEIDLFVDRTPPTPIASNWSMGPVAVHWSPDGTMLLVTRQRLGGSGASDVLVMNASGTDLRIVLESGLFIEATWSQFSQAPRPPGDEPPPMRILVVGADEGSKDAPYAGVVYDLDGNLVARGLPTRATRNAVAAHPKPLDEGVLITSTLGSPEPFGPIVTEGDAGERILARGCAATWSPDGSQIAFYNGYGIAILNVDTPPHDVEVIVSNAGLGLAEEGELREGLCEGLGISWANDATFTASTSTPDLQSAVSPEEAELLLLQVPGAGDVLRAVAGGDVEAIFGLIDWQPRPCGIPHQPSELCLDGSPAGTELPMVNVGWSIPFWVTADTLRPTLTLVLAGEPPALRFASRASQADDGLGDTYYLGLEGGPKGRGISPIGSADNIRTGIFLTVRTEAERPIAELSFLSETWSAIDLANEASLTRHEVLTFNP